jgi:hypothetical protein
MQLFKHENYDEYKEKRILIHYYVDDDDLWMHYSKSFVWILARTLPTLTEVYMIFSVSPEKCWGSISNQAMTTSFYMLSNALFIKHPNIWH